MVSLTGWSSISNAIILWFVLFASKATLGERYKERKTLIIYHGPTSTQCTGTFDGDDMSSLDEETRIKYSGQNCHGNFQFFLNHGLPRSYDDSHSSIHVQIVLSKAVYNMYREEIASLKHIHPYIRFIIREKHCHLVKASRIALQSYASGLNGYDFYIHLSCGVMGPFQPIHELSHHWGHYFTNLLTNTTKLVGASFDCAGIPHVQTLGMVWATDAPGLDILLEESGVLVGCGNTFEKKNPLPFSEEKLKQHEIDMTKAILDAGYELAVLAPAQPFHHHTNSTEHQISRFCHSNMWSLHNSDEVGTHFSQLEVPLGMLFWDAEGATTKRKDLEMSIQYQDAFHMRERTTEHIHFKACAGNHLF
uniref:Uncharacterized protein n=1 Tax=Heterosigma akashiwo TaxID=2829 RepID=A0A7S3US12_HETAK